MEETKLDVPIISNEEEVVQWQWQSDSIPFKEVDPAKWAWQNYSNDENLIIEEAFNFNKDVADLGNYEIYFKQMVQVSLKDKNNVRRVRRQGPSRFTMKMPDVKVVIRDQKTMNEAFGTVQHFLEYIMKRTPEAYVSYKRLEKLSLDCNIADFEDLVLKVKTCINKAAEARARIIKTRTGSRVRNFFSESRKMIDMIENNSSTLRDFLKAILKAYTMETFICYWLNELLRSEDWKEINVLTPYLVCLVYTFKLPDYVLENQSSQKAIQRQLGFVVKHRLYLYRGAAFTEKELVSYNPSKIQYFSWNAVTSTSKDRNIAEKFVELSRDEMKKGVVFIIEIDFDSTEEHHGMVDVSNYSRYPKEQEVILAPGTVFKLLDISLIEDDIYEIRLKITKSSHEDIPSLGPLQNRFISKDTAIIDGLPSEKSFRMLELLRGNQLIQKLEIRNSGVEEDIMQEIENVRVTTNVRKENIKLTDNTIVTSSFNILIHYFSLENINDILAFNKVRFGPESVKNSQINEESGMKNLILKEETIKIFRQNDQLKNLWEEFKKETQMRGVNLSIQKIEVENDELDGFFESIREWRSLKDLAMEFNERPTDSIKNFESLCEAISSLPTLNQLSLKFPFSDEGLSLLQKGLRPIEGLQNLSLICGESDISDEGLGSLSDILMFLTNLQQFSLRLGGSFLTSDKGLNNFSNALMSQKSLQHLSLEFVAYRLPNEELNCFGSAIISLTSLRYLHLGFRNCDDISDEGVNCIKSALKSLTSLLHLSCDFFDCKGISSESLNYLMIAFPFLTSLKHFRIKVQSDRFDSNYLKNALLSLIPLQQLSLDRISSLEIGFQGVLNFKREFTSPSFIHALSLDLRNCSRISDADFEYLKDAMILSKSLQRFSIYLTDCNNISDKELNHLSSVLILLTSLQHLSLSFERCKQISNEGLNYLKGALLSLTALQSLSLNFEGCNRISDEGFNHLNSALIFFTSLQYLSLNFKGCKQISDEGLNSLREALISFTSLQYLSLDFELCTNISDAGLHFLNSALISLMLLLNLSIPFWESGEEQSANTSISLQYLSLNFGGCKRISDEGLDNLKVSLESLTKVTSLQHLSLNFEGCNKISGKGSHSLYSALLSLTSLQQLSLNFENCEEISGDTLNHLKIALASLTYLQELSLNFGGCDQVSDEALHHLKVALTSPMPLLSLQRLSLNFERCYLITDKGFNHLSNLVVSLTSLQHLSLTFGKCKQISNEGLNYLKDAFFSLKSLHRLSLSFEGCSRISDEGFNYLKNALVGQTSLQHLSLNFEGCRHISDEGLNFLKDALILLISLQYLSLNVRCCKISFQGRQDLVSLLHERFPNTHLLLELISSQKK